MAQIRHEEVLIVLSQVLADLVRGEFQQLQNKADSSERFQLYLNPRPASNLPIFQKRFLLRRHIERCVGGRVPPTNFGGARGWDGMGDVAGGRGEWILLCSSHRLDINCGY